MGFSGYKYFIIPLYTCLTRPAVARLVRWTNAPTTGLELIAQNIIKNHQVALFAADLLLYSDAPLRRVRTRVNGN